ncbi:MAG: response regulator [Ignavibacteria bacterium]|nr:response regulator [Ignavibacteria bacterium]
MVKDAYRILVIDDRPDNVYYLQSRLQAEKFLVLTAFSGPEGIEKAKAEKPDLILLDIMMPGMDGYEVCKILTNDEDTKDIPIILVTAKVDGRDVAEGLRVGAFDYIKKPFDKMELIARVNSALRYSEMKKKAIQHEKYQIFEATVFTANHEIKQPLTIMSLAVNAIKRELQKQDLNKELISEKLNYIEEGIKKITNVLNKLNAIKHTEGKEEYDKEKDVRMVSFDDLKKEIFDS